MIIQDPAIPEMITKISDHFNNNIATRFLRPLLAQILSDNELSRRMSDIIDHPESFASQGVHIDELYLQIQAFARFVYMVRCDVLPNLRVLSGTVDSRDANKVFRDMAVSNFGSNVKVLSDLVHELYIRTVAYDKLHSGPSRPVYRDIPGLEEIGRYLVEN